MFKNLLIALYLLYFFKFNLTNCASVIQVTEQDSKNGMKSDMTQDPKPSGRQLELPDNDIPLNPPRKPRTEGIITQVINFFRDLIGGRGRTDDERGVNDGDGYPDRGNRDSDGLLTYIRKRVSGFIDSLITTFGGSSQRMPEANFPYNKREPYRNL